MYHAYTLFTHMYLLDKVQVIIPTGSTKRLQIDIYIPQIDIERGREAGTVGRQAGTADIYIHCAHSVGYWVYICLQ